MGGMNWTERECETGMNVAPLGTIVVAQARGAGSLGLAGSSGDDRSRCIKETSRRQSQQKLMID